MSNCSGHQITIKKYDCKNDEAVISMVEMTAFQRMRQGFKAISRKY